jgi:hypothetical protein
VFRFDDSESVAVEIELQPAGAPGAAAPTAERDFHSASAGQLPGGVGEACLLASTLQYVIVYSRWSFAGAVTRSPQASMPRSPAEVTVTLALMMLAPWCVS